MRIIVFLLLLCSPFCLEAALPDTRSAPVINSLNGMKYSVEFIGVHDKEIIQQLQNSSTTYSLKNKKNSLNYQQLRRRAESDLDQMKEICQYWGYFRPEIDFSILRTTEPKVVFEITLGPLYTIESVEVIPQTIIWDRTLLPQGAAAKTEAILQAEETILSSLKKSGFASAKLTKKEIFANNATQKVTCNFYIETGPQFRFGPLTIEGSRKVKESYIRKHLLFKEGEPYDIEKIEKSINSLEKSSLFSQVFIKEGKGVEQNELPLTLVLKEGKLRSVGGGVNYTTSKGPGVGFSWEHRNFRRSGELLSCNIETWQKFQNAKLKWVQPYFGSLNQECSWLFEFDRQNTIGFFSRTFAASSTIDRHFNPQWNGSVGAKFESLKSISPSQHATYYLFKAPLGIKWTNTEDILDPKEGMNLSIKFTPAYQFVLPTFSYFTHTTTLSLYHSVFDNSLTGACKIVVGNIFGASRFFIPEPDLFFSGTENTLRGYRYLSVSPLDKEGRPIGGRSLFATSFEGRSRFDNGWGVVAFYDVGNVYSSNFFDFKQRLLHSVGLGARYDTPFGPLRLDLAVPIKRRHIDPPFQIYFSIGQSF